MKNFISGVKLKSTIPKDILLEYLTSYNKFCILKNKKYRTELESFELSLARDFIKWVHYYYGV